MKKANPSRKSGATVSTRSTPTSPATAPKVSSGPIVKDLYFSDNRFSEGLFEIICGDLVGMGTFRKVFDFRWDPTMVVKFETDD